MDFDSGFYQCTQWMKLWRQVNGVIEINEKVRDYISYQIVEKHTYSLSFFQGPGIFLPHQGCGISSRFEEEWAK